ncbi:hypothetical protein EYC84_011583 [Monilinia fructicola]|uniref:Syntaxin 6/10/61 N-terminal domain-containing protein n=1 Tax=Monilinia fructicola TaxID=38448 RepID=A0A5M9J5H6_MONFR|nr:hypothetical protein EYC84_011583 [Monilinia fructicola]
MKMIPFYKCRLMYTTNYPSARPLFTSYLRIHSLTKSPHPTPELLSARSDLTPPPSPSSQRPLGLRDSIQAIQADPYKYGLQIEEVSRRVRMIDEIGGEVDDMREELGKPWQHTGAPRRRRRRRTPHETSRRTTTTPRNSNTSSSCRCSGSKMRSSTASSITVGNLRQQAE